ncbi:MAG: SprT-like domain-containing protein [Bacteroidota bacterium]|nr:SprT-like domain-containing protein [Bacteroidota bacterium]MDP3145131.1 SprT-like domain-containing protein [Bacteroidota bacterium]MDP3556167.1 SprT-like domain-containing protein [Bacteroidota bacterium]
MDIRAVQYQRNSEILKKYLPEETVELISEWIIDYDFKLKITKERKTRLGDYTSPRDGLNHTITINYNLNKYAFLITLVHEIAHLVTFNEHKNRVNPHGLEWKQNFQKMMQPFLTPDIFPLEIFAALRKYLQNPAASSCSDIQLLRTLKLHDADSDTIFLEHLPLNTLFLYNGSRIFKKGERIRKRFKCVEIKSNVVYLFNPLTEVEIFDSNAQLV